MDIEPLPKVDSNETTEDYNESSAEDGEKIPDTTIENSSNSSSEKDSTNTWKAIEGLQNENDVAKSDGFLSPMSLPPVAKSVKKAQESKPVSMAFKSKFAIPADIYKAPRIMAFAMELPSHTKAEAASDDNVKSSPRVEDKESDGGKKSSRPKPPPAKLSYEPPGWGSAIMEEKYSFEV